MSMAPRILCKTSTLNNRRITRRLNGTRSRRAAEPEGRPRTVPRAGGPRGGDAGPETRDADTGGGAAAGRAGPDRADRPRPGGTRDAPLKHSIRPIAEGQARLRTYT